MKKKFWIVAMLIVVVAMLALPLASASATGGGQVHRTWLCNPGHNLVQVRLDQVIEKLSHGWTMPVVWHNGWTCGELPPVPTEVPTEEPTALPTIPAVSEPVFYVEHYELTLQGQCRYVASIGGGAEYSAVGEHAAKWYRDPMGPGSHSQWFTDFFSALPLNDGVADGNIVITCGQFSETLTFDITTYLGDHVWAAHFLD